MSSNPLLILAAKMYVFEKTRGGFFRPHVVISEMLENHPWFFSNHLWVFKKPRVGFLFKNHPWFFNMSAHRNKKVLKHWLVFPWKNTFFQNNFSQLPPEAEFHWFDIILFHSSTALFQENKNSDLIWNERVLFWVRFDSHLRSFWTKS